MKIQIFKGQFQFLQMTISFSLFYLMENKLELSEELTKLLPQIGLFSSIDLIFLNNAQANSRKMIEGFTNELNFIFPLLLLKMEDRNYPLSSWLEKTELKYFDPDSISSDPDEITKIKSLYIMWVTKASENYKNRIIQSAGDFHLFFVDVIIPHTGDEKFSIEEIYKQFDLHRGESYWLQIGSRKNNHQNGRIYALFIDHEHNNIVVYKIDKYIPEGKVDEIGTISRFVNLEDKLTIQYIEETAIFKMANNSYVYTKEQVEEIKNAIDSENFVPGSFEEEKIEVVYEEPECEMCGG